MGKQTIFTVKNHLAELERVSHLVEEFSARCHVPAKVTFEIKVALDEVLTNVMSYAYDDGREHDIIVRLLNTAGELAVEVEDDGRPFNPLEVAPAEVDKPVAERAIGGLGLHMVRTLVDTLEYRRQPGANLLVMRKRVVAS
jgi:serine/threonine-protein kinase RsbW